MNAIDGTRRSKSLCVYTVPWRAAALPIDETVEFQVIVDPHLEGSVDRMATEVTYEPTEKQSRFGTWLKRDSTTFSVYYRSRAHSADDAAVRSRFPQCEGCRREAWIH